MDNLYEYLKELYSRQKQKVPNTEKLDEIVSLLKASNTYPEITFGYMTPGYSGSYFPDTNKVRLSNMAANPLTTATHELFHALDKTMGSHYFELYQKQFRRKEPTTKQEKQFYDAYAKLDYASVPYSKDVEEYRKSFPERRAYGVGNYSGGGVNHPTTPHSDATNATEMAILMDLYRKSLNKGK